MTIARTFPLEMVKLSLVGLLCFAVQTRTSADPKDSATNPGRVNGRWTQRKQMDEGAVFAGTVAGPGGRIYVVTGLTGNPEHLSASNRVYDTAADTWATLASIPTPRTEPGAALGPDGKIYIIGGDPSHRKDPSRMNVVEAYDPKTDKWEARKPLPTPRTALC